LLPFDAGGRFSKSDVESDVASKVDLVESADRDEKKQFDKEI